MSLYAPLELPHLTERKPIILDEPELVVGYTPLTAGCVVILRSGTELAVKLTTLQARKRVQAHLDVRRRCRGRHPSGRTTSRKRLGR